MLSEPQVRISTGSRFEHIDLIQVIIDDSMNRLGLDEDARHWVGLAVREAVANAIKHGNRLDPHKQVEVELAVEDGKAVIRVMDHGGGFEPEKVRDPLAKEHLLEPNGRGILFMRSFMDAVEYSSGPTGGTIVTLRKQLGE